MEQRIKIIGHLNHEFKTKKQNDRILKEHARQRELEAKRGLVSEVEYRKREFKSLQ